MSLATARANARPGGAAAVERLMRPRSVAIVGISSKPGSAGHTALANFTVNKFAGDIYLVGRSGGEIEGRKVYSSVDELPEGVDLAVFTLPAAGVKEALEACVRRKVRAVVVFASGFAEAGNRGAQEEIAKIAADGGIAMLGPNCLGYTNFVDGLNIGFASAQPVPKLTSTGAPALAIISQSGGFMAHLRQAFDGRNLPTSYTVSPGNEGGLDLVDFVEFLTTDKSTQAIVLYAEHIRRPAEFLVAAKAARAAGKPVILMHPGRGQAAQKAAQSHTGALAGNYEVMRTQVAHAGIALVETLDELADTSEILARFPEPPTKGVGILTFSGAFCAIAHDFCESIGFDVPELSKEGQAALQKRLPAFITPHNPLDLTTQPIWEPDLVGLGAKTLLDDPGIGSVVISITVGGPEQSVKYIKGIIEALKGNKKPLVFSILGDTSPLAPEFLALARESHMILSRSSERSLRAMAQATAHGRAVAAAKNSVPAAPIPNLPKLGSGPQPEWLGKQVFAAAGIKTPEGALAKTADEAAATAKKIGFPVAMKAQAAKLAHKTEAGGVMLNIADEAGVRAAWQKLHDNIEKHAPGMKLDGVLVEKMSQKGLELVVGAKRDPQWGPVVLVGLGGIMVEALGDVRLLPADLPEAAIVEELHKLKAAKLLGPFRGAPAVDVEAVAKVAATIGRLMRTVPEIEEIDVNPL
ncbi:MAG TPA: acetate--CoA ligase family protein, partial [Xanthobacteraceae bacterium]|nr:acetate--CoA ligase family protein [Xanthobacteraceae bacterium]